MTEGNHKEAWKDNIPDQDTALIGGQSGHEDNLVDVKVGQD